MRTIILIWGAAILVYLFVTHASGTSTVVNSVSNFTSGITKTLQGR